MFLIPIFLVFTTSGRERTPSRNLSTQFHVLSNTYLLQLIDRLCKVISRRFTSINGRHLIFFYLFYGQQRTCLSFLIIKKKQNDFMSCSHLTGRSFIFFFSFSFLSLLQTSKSPLYYILSLFISYSKSTSTPFHKTPPSRTYPYLLSLSSINPIIILFTSRLQTSLISYVSKYILK